MKIIILKKLLIIKCKGQKDKKFVEQTLQTVIDSMNLDEDNPNAIMIDS